MKWEEIDWKQEQGEFEAALDRLGYIVHPEYLKIAYEPYKQDLFELLGGSFTYEREIGIQKPAYEIEEDFVNSDFFDLPFFKAFLKKVKGHPEEHSFNYLFYDTFFYAKNSLPKYFYSHITKHKETRLYIDDNTYVSAKEKPFKALAKFNWIPEEAQMLEEARLRHSQLLNQKQLRGTLKLSIAPIDYIKLSDDTTGWSSCLSIQENGQFKAGTLEMLSSPFVVIASLDAPKKWRQLFIINEKVLLSVKGYPYQNEELNKICIDILRELACKNKGWVYEELPEDQKDRILPATRLMYNDLNSLANRELASYWAAPELAHSDTKYYFNYGDQCFCLTCGKEFAAENDIWDGSAATLSYNLGCPSCLGLKQCDNCGEWVYDGENFSEDIYGNSICENCRYESYTWSDIYGIYIHNDEAVRVLCDNDNKELILTKSDVDEFSAYFKHNHWAGPYYELHEEDLVEEVSKEELEYFYALFE